MHYLLTRGQRIRLPFTAPLECSVQSQLRKLNPGHKDASCAAGLDQSDQFHSGCSPTENVSLLEQLKRGELLSILDNVYNFGQTPHCSDQKVKSCERLVHLLDVVCQDARAWVRFPTHEQFSAHTTSCIAILMRSILMCMVLTNPLPDALLRCSANGVQNPEICMQGRLHAALQPLCGTNGLVSGPNIPNHDSMYFLSETKKLLSKMCDPRTVAWASKFGAALVAVKSSGPVAKTFIYAVCLDGWRNTTHRCGFLQLCASLQTRAALCNQLKTLCQSLLVHVATHEYSQVRIQVASAYMDQAEAISACLNSAASDCSKHDPMSIESVQGCRQRSIFLHV